MIILINDFLLNLIQKICSCSLKLCAYRITTFSNQLSMLHWNHYMIFGFILEKNRPNRGWCDKNISLFVNYSLQPFHIALQIKTIVNKYHISVTLSKYYAEKKRLPIEKRFMPWSFYLWKRYVNQIWIFICVSLMNVLSWFIYGPFADCFIK